MHNVVNWILVVLGGILIVAEVLLGLLFGDRNSFLSRDPEWHPAQGTTYALGDFVRYALGR